MQFELDAEQLALQESLQRFFAAEYDFEKRRALLGTEYGSSPRLWSAFAEQGWLSIGIPGEHGGIGGAVETAIVMEELGRHLVLEPWFGTMALGVPLLARAGSPGQQAALFARVAAGECRLALAHGEAEARYATDHVRTTVRRAGADYLLDGVKTTILDGGAADTFIVSARAAPGAPVQLFLVAPDAPGVRCTRYRTQDGRSAADLVLAGARLPADQLLGESPDADALPALTRALEAGIAALCAEAVGAMDAALQATVEYTKSRKQFGQPIARFQALQHRMADMFVCATQARSMSLLATGRCASEDAALRRRDIAAAKAFVGKAARFVGQQAVQLHGGMGMADELAVSHHFKRLTTACIALGDSAYHRATVSDAILLDAVPASEVA